MSNFKGHLEAGSFTGGVAGLFTMVITMDFKASLAVTLAVITGALFPDVDTKSHPTKICVLTIVGLFSYGYLYDKSYLMYGANLTYAFFLAQLSPHRSITHKYYLPILAFICAFWCQNILTACFGIGLAVHYVLDGILPDKWRNFRIFRFKKGIPFIGWP